MPEGFQTQLSETFNKQRREGAPLLEAYLDASGRMAFRFANEGGDPVAQPRVTTPGFVPPSSGLPASTPSPSSTSNVTPQASGVLTGGVNDKIEGVGGAGETVGDSDRGFVGFQSQPLSGTQRGLASALAGPFSPIASLGLRGLQSLGTGFVGGGSPKPGTSQFNPIGALNEQSRTGIFESDVEEFGLTSPTFDFTLGDRTGLASPSAGDVGGSVASTPQGAIDVQTQVDTFSSMRDLDNMSSLGTEGGGRDSGSDRDDGGDRVGDAGASFGGGSRGPF